MMSARVQLRQCFRPVDKASCICNNIYKMYWIYFAKGVENDFAEIAAFHRKIIFNSIEKQLKDEPAKPTKHRKLLKGIMPPWNAVPPIWELRVGKYRVFYDVSEMEKTVYIRAVKEKPQDKTTEEIL